MHRKYASLTASKLFVYTGVLVSSSPDIRNHAQGAFHVRPTYIGAASHDLHEISQVMQ